MKKVVFGCFALAVGVMGPLPSAAQSQGGVTGNLLIAPSLLSYSGLRSRTSSTSRAFTLYEIKLSYQVSPGFYLGASYQVEDETIRNSGFSSASLNNTASNRRTSLGPSLGYISQTYHFVFSYFVDSKWNSSSTANDVQSRNDYTGTGWQIDVGYKIPVWAFFFGPQISYKMFTYDKVSTDGAASASISPRLEVTSVEPSVTLFLFF